MDKAYKEWIVEVKRKVRSSQIKAAIAVNTALIEFYWDLGRMVCEKENVWGSKLLENLSRDLKEEFPDMSGFSVSNLKTCRLFYKYFSVGSQAVNELQYYNYQEYFQTITKIPWGHIKIIITKIKDITEAFFYIQKTIENNWSRDVLGLQIKSDLFSRQGKAVSNFSDTLPDPDSDLAQQTLKDPYIFDFLQLADDYKERDIENQLTEHITRFLLELGKGFSFVGRQYRVMLNEREYFIDLLFYHIPMQCYVVVELKNRDFEPEFTGKLNFYLTLINKTLKRASDSPTVGILLCKSKDNLEVEYALQDIQKPIGVSEFKLNKTLPDNLKSSLPSIDELEEELRKFE